MFIRSLSLTVFVMSAGFGEPGRSRPLPPVEPVTRVILEQRKARKQARDQAISPQSTAGTLQDPHYKALFDIYMDRLVLLQGENRPQPTVNGAIFLVDHLYEDMGNSTLNHRWQDMVVHDIQRLATRPNVEPHAVNVLREGLLAYEAAGGGDANPFVKIRLARALTVLGGPAHPECDQRAVELTEEAATWADRLQHDHYIRMVRKYREKILAIAGPQEMTPVERADARQEADRLIRALSLGEAPDVSIVENAAKLATVDFGRPELNNDMISRLLIAYRMTLVKSRRAPKNVVRAIDKKLLWLARDSRKLSGERHWSLWAEAVANLGPRASRDMKRYVFHEGQKQESDPKVARALGKARKNLKQ